MQAVADDFEEFEMIVSEIAKWTNANDGVPNSTQIERALLKAIADKRVKAYEADGPSNQLTETQADSENLQRLWFYITDQGKTQMQSFEASVGEAERK
jgi:uncharacterized Zn finger protein